MKALLVETMLVGTSCVIHDEKTQFMDSPSLCLKNTGVVSLALENGSFAPSNKPRKIN